MGIILKKTDKLPLGSMWHVGNYVYIMLDQPNESTVAHLDPVKGNGVCH